MPSRPGAAVVVMVVTAACAAAGTGTVRLTPAANPIQVENARRGTTAWLRRQAPPGVVDAYTSEVSAAPGDTVHVHVSTTPAASYRVEVIRLGWYGGLGGRLLECVPSCESGRPGVPRAAPAPSPASGLLALAWPSSDALTVSRDWVSGYYYLDVVLTTGPWAGTVRHVPLVVRAPPDGRSLILAQASVNTWEAYNGWGGSSLYSRFGTVAGSHVSFSRPYDLVHQGPASWELAGVHFLERHGYDVSYTTDVDTDRDPSSLLAHALVMTLGHDEYWSHAMRDAFEQARDAGVSLAFMGANDGYWQVRYEDDHRTLVEYRDPRLDPLSDPALKTTTFRNLDPPRPECELLGVGYGQVGDTTDYVVSDDAPGDSWFLHTGLAAGSVLRGLVGYEWNGVVPGCDVPPLTVLFHHEQLNGAPVAEGVRSNADAVRYVASSGARVFDGGSLQFAWGLDTLQEHYDARLDRFMRNGLDDLTRPPYPASVQAEALGARVAVAVPPAAAVQVDGMVIYRHPGPRWFAPDGPRVVRIEVPHCSVFLDDPGRGVFRYRVAYAGEWRESVAVIAASPVWVTPVERRAQHVNACVSPGK